MSLSRLQSYSTKIRGGYRRDGMIVPAASNEHYDYQYHHYRRFDPETNEA